MSRISDWFTIDHVEKDTYIISEYRHWDHIGGSILQVLHTPGHSTAHHNLNIQPEILLRIRDAFQQLKAEGELYHGSGTFENKDFAIWL